MGPGFVGDLQLCSDGFISAWKLGALQALLGDTGPFLSGYWARTILGLYWRVGSPITWMFAGFSNRP